jgi:hypothetical protein
MLYYWYSGEFKLNGAHWYFSYIYCLVDSIHGQLSNAYINSAVSAGTYI